MIHWDGGGAGIGCTAVKAEIEAIRQDSGVPEGADVVLRAVDMRDATHVTCAECVAEMTAILVRAQLGQDHRRMAATRAKCKMPKRGEVFPTAYIAALAQIIGEVSSGIAAEQRLVAKRLNQVAVKRYGPGGPRGEITKFPGTP